MVERSSSSRKAALSPIAYGSESTLQRKSGVQRKKEEPTVKAVVEKQVDKVTRARIKGSLLRFCNRSLKGFPGALEKAKEIIARNEFLLPSRVKLLLKKTGEELTLKAEDWFRELFSPGKPNEELMRKAKLMEWAKGNARNVIRALKSGIFAELRTLLAVSELEHDQLVEGSTLFDANSEPNARGIDIQVKNPRKNKLTKIQVKAGSNIPKKSIKNKAARLIQGVREISFPDLITKVARALRVPELKMKIFWKQHTAHS